MYCLKFSKATRPLKRREKGDLELNKFFAALGVIFAVLILLVASGVGSIWAYQKYLALSAPPVTARPEGRDERQPEPAAAKSEAPAPQPKNDAPSAPAPASDDGLRCAVWDRPRLMAESAAGKALSKYAADYAAVMDANVKSLNDAIAAKMPGLNVAEARKLIAQCKERKTGIQRDVNEFLTQLVTQAAAELPLLNRGVLIEKTAATWAAAEADATGALIASLDAVNVELPELPRRLEVKPPKPAAPPGNNKKK